MSLTNKFKSIEVSNDIPIWGKFNITEEQYNIVKRIYDLYSESYDIHIEFINKLCDFIERNYDYDKYKINENYESLRDKYNLKDTAVDMTYLQLNSVVFKSLRTLLFYNLESYINNWRFENGKKFTEFSYLIPKGVEEKLSIEDVLNEINAKGWWL